MPAIIAEIKKASPARGLLTEEFEPARIARDYEHGGAAALSVLTDEKFFCGSLSDLREARNAVTLPVLRKDFIISELQILEAAATGADAILLIAAVLDEDQLRRFREFASQFLLAALIEVHDRDELAKAVDSGASIIGVNNRDLHTFETRVETSLDLARHIPPNVVAVSESGIRDRSQVRLLFDAGYRAFLVGEHLMRSADPVHALRSLLAD